MQSSRTVLVAGEHPTVHGLSAAMQHLLSASSVAYMYLITAVCIIEVTLVHTGNSKHPACLLNHDFICRRCAY